MILATLAVFVLFVLTACNSNADSANLEPVGGESVEEDSIIENSDSGDESDGTLADGSNEDAEDSSQVKMKMIAQEGSFDLDECKQRGVYGKVYMLESKYCGHCKQTMPLFLEACSQKGVEPVVLDLAEPDQQEKMEDLGIGIVYTPTFVFGCDYYIGSRTKQDYLQMLDKFLEETK